MTNGSIKHDALSRSDSSNTIGAYAASSRKSVSSSEDHPFVVVDPRIRKFKALLAQENVDMEALSKLMWNGAIEDFRGASWRLLLGYSPANSQRRTAVLNRKREEYRDLLNRYYADLNSIELKPEWVATISAQESALIHQIRIDVPRTLPHNPLFANPMVQRALERILLMWALRHPASGYVQGINDLVTPFIVVFLREILEAKKAASDEASTSSNGNNSDSLATLASTHVAAPSGAASSAPPSLAIPLRNEPNTGETPPRSPRSDGEYSVDSDASPRDLNSVQDTPVDEEPAKPKKFSRQTEDMNIDLSQITPEEMALVEADCYWAVSKFIDCIQDNYTSSQPGIQRSLHRLEELISKLDPALSQHLSSQGVMFVQFAFRWVNCLLMRELPLNIVIRLWDTYIAEGDRFPTLHTYVCASFLLAFSKELLSSDFQTLMMFLHHLPTDDWTIATLEPLISQAFMWQAQYGDASQHLRTASTH